MENKHWRLVVCGGGNGAHTFSCLASSYPNTEVRVLTIFADEAQRWTDRLKHDDMVLTVCNSDGSFTEVKSRPSLITKDPKEALKECDIIVFIVPAFAHEQYMEILLPFIQNNSLIIGMPGQAGFEFQLFHILKDKAKSSTILSFESLPWSCRLTEYGHHAIVQGKKERVKASIIGRHNFKHDPIELIQFFLGDKPAIIPANNYLEINLLSKSTFHPPVMYGYWKDWDGVPVDNPPIFYNCMDEKSVGFLKSVDEEVIAIAKKFTELKPEIKMPWIAPAYDWLIEHYRYQIRDKTDLLTAFRTNKGYEGLMHPMKQTQNGKYVPDFQARYVREDIPHGLVVFRGMAAIVGVETPVMDKVIVWCQKLLGKEYLLNSELVGKDIASSRAPQSFGLNTFEDLMYIQ